MSPELALFLLKVLVTVLFIFFATVIYIFKTKESRKMKAEVKGYVHPSFRDVLKAFKYNLEVGHEREGAAMCVYYKGECVIDIWGGYADKAAERLWEKDTLQIQFSTSKVLGAVCIAILVDQDLMKYDDKIASFWPEFGNNGKEKITVEMVLTHTAGLAGLDHNITFDDAKDHEKMAKIIEKQKVNWEPGTEVGYHAFSYGWIVDQIIRRIDKKKRGIGQFFKEEIAMKHNLDIHIGLPLEESWRVARITRPSIIDRISEYLDDSAHANYPFIFRQYIMGDGLLMKVANNPSWLQIIFKVTLNNPRIYTLEQTAALGIATARDMAKFAQLVMDGKIISKKTLNLLHEPLTNQPDIVTGASTTRGRGVSFVNIQYHKFKANLIGHAGLGGQNMRWDSDNQLALAYSSNGLKSGLTDRARTYVRVLTALSRTLHELSDIPQSCPCRSSSSSSSNIKEMLHRENA